MKSETKKGQVMPEKHWLAHEQMAKAHGISSQAFRQWGVSPVAKIGNKIFYVAGDVTANRLENQAVGLQKRDSAELIQAEREAKLKLTEAQGEGQELKNSQLRKEITGHEVIVWLPVLNEPISKWPAFGYARLDGPNDRGDFDEVGACPGDKVNSHADARSNPYRPRWPRD